MFQVSSAWMDPVEFPDLWDAVDHIMIHAKASKAYHGGLIYLYEIVQGEKVLESVWQVYKIVYGVRIKLIR